MWSKRYYKLKRDLSNKLHCSLSLPSWAHCSQKRRWFWERGFCIEEDLHAVHGAADVDELPKQTGITCRCWSMCWQLSKWSCTVRQRHTDYVSTIVLRHHSSSSTLRFATCTVFVGLLLPNFDQSAAVTLRTSYYFAVRKSFFAIADISPKYKHHQFLKLCLFLSKSQLTSQLIFTITK